MMFWVVGVERMEIKWLKKALENLNSEAEFIARDNPEAAKRIVLRINQAVMKLADNPSSGRAGRISGVRELVITDTRYIVPYRVRPELQRVEILRVFHCSRKLPRRW